MELSPLHQQTKTLPDLTRVLLGDLDQRIGEVFPRTLSQIIQRVFITGCGDSHHAAINAELAFKQLAGLPCEAHNSMNFARYAVPFLPPPQNGGNLILAVSVSGRVSRTIEALELARQKGALTVAVTGSRQTPLAQVADFVLETAVPPLPNELQGLIVPGTRSYYASQLALYLLAIHIGQQRNHLTEITSNLLQQEILSSADLMEETISKCDSITYKAAEAWQEENSFVFCGSGPNFGSASFSAAKILEASGDFAIAQDIEEWAHLQYFARERKTPTVLISAADRDKDRVLEIATAAHKIGRQVALTAPENSLLAQTSDIDFLFPLAGKIRECFSPLLASLPGILLASHRAQSINEPYFRDFSGGRSPVGGGGISRIRNSHRIKTVPNHEILG